MVIYGVALLAGCMLVGLWAGDVLGMLLGVNSNVGGVGIAMLMLIFLGGYLMDKGKMPSGTEERHYLLERYVYPHCGGHGGESRCCRSLRWWNDRATGKPGGSWCKLCPGARSHASWPAQSGFHVAPTTASSVSKSQDKHSSSSSASARTRPAR